MAADEQRLDRIDRDLQDLKNNINKELQELKLKLNTQEVTCLRIEADIKKLVTVDRFSPVAYIAYGLAAGILTSALGAVLSLVFIRGG